MTQLDRESGQVSTSAVVGVTLGAVAMLSSWMLIGALFGLAGVVTAGVGLVCKAQPRSLLAAGLVMSCLGVLGSLGFASGYSRLAQSLREELRSVTEEPDFEDWIGKPAPPLTVRAIDGRVVQLDQLRGRAVILDFWATWCRPCREEMPHLARLDEETSDEELTIIGVTMEDAGTVRRFASQHAVHFPLGSATALPAPYSEVRSIPTTFFIDPSGVIRHVHRGYCDYDTLHRLVRQTADAHAP